MHTAYQSAATTGNASAFFRLLRSPLKFRMFLLKSLPAAFFSGVRIISVGETRAEVTVPYKWFSRNPFRSTYFACLSMAAEMSTGVLAMGHSYKLKPTVSMLVLRVEGEFFKKAIGQTIFICEEGEKIREVIAQAIESGTAQSIRALSRGTNEKGERVAEFYITWSFKTRK